MVLQKMFKPNSTFLRAYWKSATYVYKIKFNILSKEIIQENNLISINNDYFTPDEFYNEVDAISQTCKLYLHMNISSFSYHFDDLKYLLENCQRKPKLIGISECRLRTNRTVLSNIDMKD